MKKILIATTALVATAGMAAAEISFGGYGRFGVAYDENNANEEVYLEQRFRLTITAVTETSGGVKVEGRFRLQADDNAGLNTAAGKGPGAAGFAVTTGGLRFDVGNISDVLDSGDLHNFAGQWVGLTGTFNKYNNFSNFQANGFDQNDGVQMVKARYSVGDFTGSASYSPESGADAEYWQAGVAYNFGPAKVAAIYGSNDNLGASYDYWVIGVDGAFGDVAYSAMYGDNDANADASWGLSAGYSMSEATLLQATVSEGGAVGNDTSFAAGFIHSLGGGTTLRGAAGQKNTGNNYAELGLRFDF